jgi:hypothetical protein
MLYSFSNSLQNFDRSRMSVQQHRAAVNSHQSYGCICLIDFTHRFHLWISCSPSDLPHRLHSLIGFIDLSDQL